MKYHIYIILSFVYLASASISDARGNVAYSLDEKGVPRWLAEERKSNVSDLRYSLRFDIPEGTAEEVEGKETVSCTLGRRADLVLDFREDARKIHSVRANGKECPVVAENEHLTVPGKFLRKGANRIEIEFTAGGQSLNRRDGYMYTLFVPDRARTAFPCFDQPDLKAEFILELEIPSHWKAVGNSALESSVNVPDREGRKILKFKPTSPLPTYLFAFAAGEFEYQYFTDEGIGAYHRESDPAKVAQLQDIARQVKFALNWQEEFTGVPYPFEKYDFVVLPGFQFGGMEHAGATFYNDTRLFLPASPTPDERLRQTELIAHETSHMWFGDAVTMEWFNDVWTKEVFANYFAAEITAPLYPDLDHSLNWLKTYKAAAVAQDRTQGRTSIRQELDNLGNAGLVYNSIIYNKAPVMLRKMVELMGGEAFREGIRKYVRKYLYGNATWDDLIEILSGETDADLRSFSREWVDSEMWPVHRAVSFRDALDSETYGFIELDREQTDSLMAYFPTEDRAVSRQAALMNLHENFCAGNIGNAKWLDFLIGALANERDHLAASSMISYMAEPLLLEHRDSGENRCERRHHNAREASLSEMSDRHPLPSVRTQLLRLLMKNGSTAANTERLWEIWKRGNDGRLSESDYMTLTYELCVRLPQMADRLIEVQRGRLTDRDRLRQFDFISRAVCTGGQSCRDSLFSSLADPANRRIEPWTLSVLYYLNHPLRDEESVKYIRPALDLLPETQRTGDIFFPGNWCERLLAGHRSPAALEEVRKYLSDNPGLHPLLRKKVLQAVYPLERACSTEKETTESPTGTGFGIYSTGKPISPEKPDFIYIVSTNVVSAKDSTGNVSWTASLDRRDRMFFDKESAFVNTNIAQGDFNFISPYYHQFTFDATNLEADEFSIVYAKVAEEITDFFDWYVSEVNGGRKFVVAGFSQGAMLTRDILKGMDGDAFSRMAAAYMIGYRLSAEDLSHPHIRAAECESDTQATISFNSVSKPEAIWDLVTEGAATCINPVNWHTDRTPAELTYGGDTGTVRVDPERNVLIVDLNAEKYADWMRANPVFSKLNPYNLHHWDLLFYTRQLHDNALLRVRCSDR